MSEITRALNVEVRPHFRSAVMWSWGPFISSATEVQGEMATKNWMVGIFVFPGISVSLTLTIAQ